MAKKNRFKTIQIIEKELHDHVIEWLATLLTLIGAILNAGLIKLSVLDGYTLSFYIWSISNILWITFALKHKHWSVFITFAALLLVNILSIITNKLWLW
ncbi:hypothetical protein FJZ18_01000 [Candidatus Pacearchaeota archaeon]|nr:hypothetical protein [Candidatus Pacearchaeota archaeon]